MTGQSILLIGFGQSNADAHYAGPRLAAPLLDDPRIVVPNDGLGYRGTLRKKPHETGISGFHPYAQDNRSTMSLLAAAAARVLHDLGDDAPAQVIIRTAAKGGRRFTPVDHPSGQVEGLLVDESGGWSPHFSNFIENVQEICRIAAAEGRPVAAICPVFLHGESDRSLPGDAYRAMATQMLDWTASALAPLKVPVHWFAVQAGGTNQSGAGNAWPNRRALLVLASRRADLTVAAPGYAYGLEDAIHFSARGKALLGETIGLAVTGWLRGRPRSLPRLQEVRARGNALCLTFSGDVDLALDPNPSCGHHGFALTDATIRAVRARGREVVLELDAPTRRISGLSYAWKDRRAVEASDGDPGYPAGGGALRLAQGTPSILIAGETLHDWVPGFAYGA